MPKDKKLRVEIIWLYHDILVPKHKRRWNITELVTRNYQWPVVIKDVGKYIDGCDMCQRIKSRMETLVGKLKLSEVLEKL